jgi:hypothetical protein
MRTPRSGGWVNASRDPNLKHIRADVTVPKECPLFVEIKKREMWSVDTLPNLGDSPEAWVPVQWYKEALPKAQDAGKNMCLVFAKNRMKPLAMLSTEDLKAVCGRTNGYKMSFKLKLADMVLHVVPFEAFLEKFREHQLSLKAEAR